MKVLRIAIGVVLIATGCVLAVHVGIAALTEGSDVWWAAWLLGVSGAALIYLTLRRSSAIPGRTAQTLTTRLTCEVSVQNASLRTHRTWPTP